jgi:hypothetical protein
LNLEMTITRAPVVASSIPRPGVGASQRPSVLRSSRAAVAEATRSNAAVDRSTAPRPRVVRDPAPSLIFSIRGNSQYLALLDDI